MIRVHQILSDEEWHDREEVLAEVIPLVDRTDALDAARGDEYWRQRHNMRRRGGDEYRKWIAENPSVLDWEPAPDSRAYDANWGARQGLITRINRDKSISVVRARRGNKLTMVKGGGATS